MFLFEEAPGFDYGQGRGNIVFLTKNLFFYCFFLEKKHVFPEKKMFFFQFCFRIIIIYLVL